MDEVQVVVVQQQRLSTIATARTGVGGRGSEVSVWAPTRALAAVAALAFTPLVTAELSA
jgi:hypothetical protein